MRTRSVVVAAWAAWVVAGCYESPPPPPAPPAWYWHAGPSASDYTDLSSTARNDVWMTALDAAGAGEIYHFNGFHWDGTALPSVPVGALYAIATTPHGDAWAAGGGDYFFYWDGSEWQDIPHPKPGIVIYGLAFADDDLGWAVGENGTILKFEASGWSEVASPTTATLRRVRVLGANAAWAVGDDGTVLRYGAGAWEDAGFTPSMNLYDLWFSGADDGWVVGDVASLYHWDGATFKRFQVSGPAAGINFRCCGFLSSDLGWAGGDEMHILRYDGVDWTLEQYLPSGIWALAAIHFVAADEGWAVGPDGFMLRYY